MTYKGWLTLAELEYEYMMCVHAKVKEGRRKNAKHTGLCQQGTVSVASTSLHISALYLWALYILRLSAKSSITEAQHVPCVIHKPWAYVFDTVNREYSIIWMISYVYNRNSKGKYSR